MTDAKPILKAGLIGSGIQASASPAMHMDEARGQGFDLTYELFDLDRVAGGAAALPRLLDAAQAQGFAGVNITHPVKQAVIPLLDELSDDARALGAVNTVVFGDGRRTGHNTDWTGFAQNLRRGLPAADLSHVVQLGAGGAGAAIAYALLKLGAERVSLHDTSPQRAEALAEVMARQFGRARIAIVSDLAGAMASAAGLVNCTPVGMAKYPGLPLPADLLRSDLWVADIVYFPLETALLQAARALGCASLDGGGMAVFQAAEAFRLFTGASPDTDRMLARFARLRPTERLEA